MDELENNQEHEKDQEAEQDHDPLSIEGKGWDLLVGGKEASFALGGDDPFDLGKLGHEAESEIPPEGDEIDLILSSIPTPEGAPATDDLPSDAFWDRGRGAETPEPSPPPGEAAEAPPRDLRPDELGYRPTPQPTASIQPAQPEPPAEQPSLAEPIRAALPDEGPVTAPPHLFPGGTEARSVVEGEAPVEPQPLAPGATSGISKGVAFETIETAGESIVEAEAPTAPSPEVSEPPQEAVLLDKDVGGPMTLPITEPSPPSDMPPWSMPQPAAMGVAAPPIGDPFESLVPMRPPTLMEPELPPDETLGRTLITPERINALWEDIEETYNLTIDDVRGHFNTTEQAISDLKRARELLLSGPENFDNAERLVVEVKARLRLEEKVRKWSQTRGSWLAVYLVAWLSLLSLVSLLTNQVAEASLRFVPDWMAATWLPGLFGGLGGVVGALWVLIKHIARRRDFDPIHTSWYVTNPFMGIALGVLTYLVVRGGGGVLTSVAGIEGSLEFSTGASLALYLLCAIVGFNQNILWALIDRFVKAILPGEKEEDKTAATEASHGVERPGGPGG